MQDHSCTPFNSTQIKIRLPSPMGQLNHKYNGSSKENKTSIFESSQLQTRSVLSNARNARSSYNISVYKYSAETRYECISLK